MIYLIAFYDAAEYQPAVCIDTDATAEMIRDCDGWEGATNEEILFSYYYEKFGSDDFRLESFWPDAEEAIPYKAMEKILNLNAALKNLISKMLQSALRLVDLHFAPASTT